MDGVDDVVGDDDDDDDDNDNDNNDDDDDDGNVCWAALPITWPRLFPSESTNKLPAEQSTTTSTNTTTTTTATT